MQLTLPPQLEWLQQLLLPSFSIRAFCHLAPLVLPCPRHVPVPSFHFPLCKQDLEEYSPADMVQSLCRMISYNIGQLAYLNAKRWAALVGMEGREG